MRIRRAVALAALLLACQCAALAAPAARSRVLRLPPAALRARAVRCSVPRLPSISSNGLLRGSVVVRVLVEADGRVSNVRVVSGHPLLRASAVAAALQWRFRPYKVKRRAFRFTGLLTFPFSTEAHGFEDVCKGLRLAPQN